MEDSVDTPPISRSHQHAHHTKHSHKDGAPTKHSSKVTFASVATTAPASTVSDSPDVESPTVVETPTVDAIAPPSVQVSPAALTKCSWVSSEAGFYDNFIAASKYDTVSFTYSNIALPYDTASLTTGVMTAHCKQVFALKSVRIVWPSLEPEYKTRTVRLIMQCYRNGQESVKAAFTFKNVSIGDVTGDELCCSSEYVVAQTLADVNAALIESMCPTNAEYMQDGVHKSVPIRALTLICTYFVKHESINKYGDISFVGVPHNLIGQFYDRVCTVGNWAISSNRLDILRALLENKETLYLGDGNPVTMMSSTITAYAILAARCLNVKIFIWLINNFPCERAAVTVAVCATQHVELIETYYAHIYTAPPDKVLKSRPVHVDSMFVSNAMNTTSGELLA